MDKPKKLQRIHLVTAILEFYLDGTRKRVRLGKIRDDSGTVVAQRGVIARGEWVKSLGLKAGDPIALEATAHFDEVETWYPRTVLEKYRTAHEVRLSRPQNVVKLETQHASLVKRSD